ncbi:hypothetical protein BDW75DRAFT_204737 [Aspergillus navahoensis]
MTSPHAPLISSLTTLYTLLVDLHYIPSSALIIPSPCHPRNSINRIAATQNGFSEAAVDLAYQIPYITDDSYRLNYETRPLCYLARLPEAGEAQGQEKNDRELQDGEGEDEWEFARDPTFQERDDLWTGCDVLVLTRGDLYGRELIYDLEKKTITEWQHFDPPEWPQLPALPMASPQNPLYAWIRNLLTLQNVPLDDDILIPHKPEEYGYPGENAGEEELAQFRARFENGERERNGLRDVYVECGWKTDTIEDLDGQLGLAIWEALEQARQRAGRDFRGGEFERRREEWKSRL